jgi:C4-dicarboxylate transporter DctM subunit
MDLSVVGFLLMVNVFLLAVGALMDSISAILIIAPLLAPIAYQLGVDPVHLGVIFIVNLEIGYLTPPIGINLFVSSAVFKKPMGAVIRSVVPFILLMFVGLGIVTYVPSLALGPVNLLMRDKEFYEEFPEPRLSKPGMLVAPSGVRPAKAPIPGGPAAAEGKRVLSIEEMMEKAEEAKGESTAPDAAGDTKRVLSIEEMMEIAEQKKAAENEP